MTCKGDIQMGSWETVCGGNRTGVPENNNCQARLGLKTESSYMLLEDTHLKCEITEVGQCWEKRSR